MSGSLYHGTLFPIPLGGGEFGYALSFLWSDYTTPDQLSVDFTLTVQPPGSKFSRIAGIYIDNAGSQTAVRLNAPDTKWRIHADKGVIVQNRVITNGLSISLRLVTAAVGPNDLTRVIISNFAFPPLYIPALA